MSLASEKNQKKIKVVSAMLGARRHYEYLIDLSNSGYLAHHYTDLYVGNKKHFKFFITRFSRFLKINLLNRVRGRDAGILIPNLTSFDLLGVLYWVSIFFGNKFGVLDHVFASFARVFGNKVNKANNRPYDYIIGCNGASLEIFKKAKIDGAKCILDQTSNPKPLEEILSAEEHTHWKDWSNQRLQPKFNLLMEREIEEWALADIIIAGSDFVRDGLLKCGVSKNKIRVVKNSPKQKGYNLVVREVYDGSRPLRILFVGRVSIMKGVPYILEALKTLPKEKFQARFLGEICINSEILSMYSDVAEFLGCVPRQDVIEHYSWADVFCLPSISEGSASAIFEAFSTGLPVITTENSGSIIVDHVHGYVVPIRDSSILANRLNSYINDPILLHEHQANVVKAVVKHDHCDSKSNFVKLIDSLG